MLHAYPSSCGCSGFGSPGFGAGSAKIDLSQTGLDKAWVECIRMQQATLGRKLTTEEVGNCSANPAFWQKNLAKHKQKQVLKGAAIVGGVALLGGVIWYATHRR